MRARNSARQHDQRRPPTTSGTKRGPARRRSRPGRGSPCTASSDRARTRPAGSAPRQRRGPARADCLTRSARCPARTPLTRVFSVSRNVVELVAGLEEVASSRCVSSVCLPLRRVVQLLHRRDRGVALGGQMSGGATTPRQFVISTSRPCVLDRRRPPCRRPGRGSAVETASTRILPASTWSANSEMRRDAGVDGAGQDALLRLAAAGVGDVLGLGRDRRPRALASQAEQDLVGAAGRAAAERDLAPGRPSCRRRGPAASCTSTPRGRRSPRARSSAPRSASSSTRSVGDLLVSIAPIITSPMTISWLDSPECLEASWESPIVPPAPGRCRPRRPCRSPWPSLDAPATSRARSSSQPPPGSAGAMIRTSRRGHSAPASSTSFPHPGAIATSAAASAPATTPLMLVRVAPAARAANALRARGGGSRVARRRRAGGGRVSTATRRRSAWSRRAVARRRSRCRCRTARAAR